MNTCEICGYDLEISKITAETVNTMTTITEASEFIKMFNKKKKANVDIAMELLFDKKALTDKMKSMDVNEETYNIITKKFDELQNNIKQKSFCWKCTNCFETYILEPGIIMTTNFANVKTTKNINNIDDIIEDQTLIRTKDFICPTCDDIVDYKDKEAIIYRPNPKEYQTVYICVNCKTVF